MDSFGVLSGNTAGVRGPSVLSDYLPTGRRFALSFHAACRAQGVPLLLDTLASLPTAEFELAVAGSDSGRFRRLANVKYLGFVENMADLYRAVDFTILPAHYEPYGLIVTESMACGTPVITHAHVGACDVLMPDEGVIVDELTLPARATPFFPARQRTLGIHPNFVRQPRVGAASTLSDAGGRAECWGGALEMAIE